MKIRINPVHFQIQITIWPLEESSSVTHIQHLKSSSNENLPFSPDGKMLALIVTDDGNNSVELYETTEWKLKKVSKTKNIRNIENVKNCIYIPLYTQFMYLDGAIGPTTRQLQSVFGFVARSET